jgi:hypothetical protein
MPAIVLAGAGLIGTGERGRSRAALIGSVAIWTFYLAARTGIINPIFMDQELRLRLLVRRVSQRSGVYKEDADNDIEVRRGRGHQEDGKNRHCVHLHGRQSLQSWLVLVGSDSHRFGAYRWYLTLKI